MTKPDDISVFLIRIRDHGALDNTAAARVMIGGNGVLRHTGERFHGVSDLAVIPAVFIAAIQNHGGLLTHVDGDRVGQVAIGSRDLRADGHLLVAGDDKGIFLEGTSGIIRDGPADVPVLQIDHIALIFGHKAQITSLLIIQIDLTAGKGQGIGVLNMYRDRSDSLPVIHQMDLSVSQRTVGGKDRRGRVAADAASLQRTHILAAGGKGPFSGRRDLVRLGAGVIHAGGLKGHGGIGRIIFGVGRDYRVVKAAVRRGGGDHQD